MVDARLASARSDAPPISHAERIALGAQSPAMQALVAAAPRPTRAQLDIVRAACASATARFHERERIRVPVDHEALARRREATLRLPPLDDGRRDPMNPAA